MNTYESIRSWSELTPISCPTHLCGRQGLALGQTATTDTELGGRFALDLSSTRSIDAVGLAAVGRLLDAARAQGGELMLIGATGATRRLILESGVHHGALLFRDRSSAERWLSRPARAPRALAA